MSIPRLRVPLLPWSPPPGSGSSSRTESCGTRDDAGVGMEGDRGDAGPEQGARHGFPSAQETMDSMDSVEKRPAWPRVVRTSQRGQLTLAKGFVDSPGYKKTRRKTA